MIPDNEFWWWVHPFCIEISWRSTSSRPFSYLSTITSLFKGAATLNIAHPDQQRSNGPGDHAIHLGWRAYEAQRANPCGHQGNGESTPRHQGGCRCRNLLFFGIQGIQQKKHTKKNKGSPRETTQIQVTLVDLLVVFFFSCHVLIYFPVVILFFFGCGKTTSTLTPGLVLLKATSSRKSTLWPHDPTRTVWKSVG